MSKEYPKTEEELIGYTWLDLVISSGGDWGEYAWAAPGTWAALAKALIGKDLIEGQDKGALGDWQWIKPNPFSVKILMNPWAQEGRIYLARAGREYISYYSL